MLHGYAQSGDIFRHKVRKLEDELRQRYDDAEFIYLDAPMKLETNDIPGLKSSNHGNDHEMRAWFDLRIVHDPPKGLHHSLAFLAGVLETQGPFDGVIAFSQGTVVGAMVASLLQGIVRERAYDMALQQSANILPYPEAFRNVRHPSFKFALFYATRVGVGRYSDWMYQHPRIATPFCHFFGRLDPMISYEERDTVLAKLSNAESPKMVAHIGGHFVPVDRESVNTATTFVEACMVAARDGSDPESRTRKSKEHLVVDGEPRERHHRTRRPHNRVLFSSRKRRSPSSVDHIQYTDIAHYALPAPMPSKLSDSCNGCRLLLYRRLNVKEIDLIHN